MTFTACPAWIETGQNESFTARQMLNSLVEYPGLATWGELAVTQSATPAMSVSIAAGRCFIRGSAANLSGQIFNAQGMYFGMNDGPLTRTIQPANATNPRIDLVCATVTDTSYGGASNSGDITVVTGTPNATPQPPATPANSYALAQVYVAANAPSITNANITTVAVPYDYLHVELSGPTLSGLPTGTKNNFGTMSIQSANSFNYQLPGTTTPSWIQGLSNGQVQLLQDGNYVFTLRYANPAGDPGALTLGIDLSGSRSIGGMFMASRDASYIDYHLSVSGQVRCQANDVLSLYHYSSNAPNCSGYFFIDKLS
jgi:hypothetical protein